jgi:hypothetical protein
MKFENRLADIDRLHEEIRGFRPLGKKALVQDGYPVTIIPPVVRPDYIEALEASNTGDNRPFVNLISNISGIICGSLRH